MNKRKILSLSLAAVLIVGSLTGCKTTADFSSKTSSDSNSAGDSAPASEYTFDYSSFLNAEGGIKGVKAESIANPGTYSGISIPKSEIAVTDEAIQVEVDKLMEYFVTQETIKEGVVTDSSTVNIDYVGTVDKVPFDGGSTDGAGTDVTIGVTQYIEGFLSQLVGHKVGETFDINVTFPADYDNAELAGKDAVFNITINHLKGEKKYPELTDAFIAENLGEQAGYKTVKEMKDAFSKEIAASQQTQYVWNTLIKNAVVKEIPQEVMDFTAGIMLSYHNRTAQQYGMSLTDYLTAMGLGTVEEFVESQKEDIKTQASNTLILLAIAEKEGFTATEEDIKEILATDDTTEAEKMYGRPYIVHAVITGKAEKFVQDKAVVAA